MHLSPDFGLTVREVERDFEITERVEMLVASDTPEAISKSVGLGVIGFAQTYARHRPDILLVLGDRFETLAAVTAALPFTIPVAHIAGGEATEGAIDDAIRHAITKMSHLHFVALEEYRRRVIQMGEEPWRVTVSGEPGLDNISATPALPIAEIEARIGMSLEPPPLLITFHPATLEPGNAEVQIAELLAALDTVEMAMVFTAPNADAEGRVIGARIQDFVRLHPNSRLVTNLGTAAYLSMMRHSAAMVGNSSSGIVEAASFELPVVNLGSRQRGRVCGKNVIHAEMKADTIVRAIRSALSPVFRERIRGLVNPYGDGKAAPRIVEVLKTVPLDRNLLAKSFYSTGEFSSREVAMERI
jgi:UDP-N-acetylglucosamine 2-epimerase (non-hydrolysing)/GDP/UDP-N,N'-diacetylbacillosamine 2-epimerase (hydrolysing)